MDAKKEVPVLLVSVLILAVCAILYELLISTISTYFLGSSILHFSVTIGLFLSAMGIGSWASRFVKDDLLDAFVWAEVALGAIGGFSAALLYAAFAYTENYYIVAFCLLLSLGGLIGLEIPIVTRALKPYEDLKQAISNVLAFDYIGSLLASVLFPLVLLPYMGIMKTSFLVGILNLLVAAFNAQVFAERLRYGAYARTAALTLTAVMGGGFLYSFQIGSLFEKALYDSEIVYSEQSAHQRIVVTQFKDEVSLYLNGSLQFSSLDEYRYHEAIVHVPMAFLPRPESVLLLGAGDGLAVRELLKYPEIERIDVVDLDSAMTRLAKKNPLFLDLNERSLHQEKVAVYNQDAFKFVENADRRYSLIIVDLPDPSRTELGKLYTRQFYQLCRRRLAADGAIVTQSTSPYFARKPFWCVNRTMEAAFPAVVPYNVYMPSFGVWGFNMALNSPPYLSEEADITPEQVSEAVQRHLTDKKLKLRYLSPEGAPALFYFAEDMVDEDVQTNELDNQIILQYYQNSWKRWE